jgi:hypothetical protein
MNSALSNERRGVRKGSGLTPILHYEMSWTWKRRLKNT